MIDRIENYLNIIESKSTYLEKNEEKLDIYEGNIVHYVDEILKHTLSPNYYEKMKHRIVPINILTRVIDKMSKVYVTSPNRKSESNQDWVDEIERMTSIDQIMGVADSYSHLFKGYLTQPYIYDRKIQLRAVPYDRFIPLAENRELPEHMTGLIVFMGMIDNETKLYYYWSDTEFIPFTSQREIYRPALEGNNGVNVYGTIPYLYGNRSRGRIMPKQDSDIAQMTKMIPVVLSDLGGAAMFQCFSIVYGIDVDADNITMTPNAFWSLKSDKQSDKTPSVGTIKPEADIEKVRDYVKDCFALWLETKGVRVGSIGSINGSNAASGISKIIDEMDIYEIKKNQIKYFEKEEKELWGKLKILNNFWSKSGLIDTDIIPDDFDFNIEFDEPKPHVPRGQIIDNLVKEVNAGFTRRRDAIIKLHPNATEQEVEEILSEAKPAARISFNGMDQNENQD